jgi:hypothetical protein
MANDEVSERKVQLTLQYAAENRRSEISLLWARSSFFWAFLAIAIGSYGAAFHGNHRTFALIVACFAAICSLCWTLANRAGKYWQEIWEKKVESLEGEALSTPIFDRKTNPAISESLFWGAKQYSPSRLACAVSDLAFALWAMTALATAFVDCWHWVTFLRILILLLTMSYALAILIWCRSGVSRPLGIHQFWTQVRQALHEWRIFWREIISN